MFRYLLILCKIAEIKIIGDVITVHAFPVLSLHFFPRLYLKVNLYRTHSAVHTLCYQSVKSMFPSVREVFLFCSVCHYFPNPLFHQHTCSGSNLKCLCDLYTVFT